MAGKSGKRNGNKNGKSNNNNNNNNNSNKTTNDPIAITTTIKTTTTTTTTTSNGQSKQVKTISSSTNNKATATATATNNAAAVTTASNNGVTISDIAFYTIMIGLIMYFIVIAYIIRLHAIHEYGPVIHEFDPYFNFRATEYLYYNGRAKFFTWFDHQSWYPLGRPVGTTIYPGMQFTAVFIKNHIIGNEKGSMSLNDVCCYIPAWFGAIASILTGLIAYECSLGCNTDTQILKMVWGVLSGISGSGSGSDNSNDSDNNVTPASENEKVKKSRTAVICGVFATGIMSIVPAHMMRSVGGGFDNESIAVSTMMLTFYFWVRSLRGGEKYSWLFGILTGIAYFYMVATWGGYVFVLNMIGLHAAILVALGRFSTKVYLSFSLFYVIGTALAIQVPVVGLTPLKSLEQLGVAAIFIGYQVLFICETIIRKKKLSRADAWKVRTRTILIATATVAIFLTFFLPSNYFGPLSSRVRGLFVKHTKTGNPLVDSVAEHQPAKPNAFYQYLHQLCTFAPVGFCVILGYFGDSPSFLSAYAVAAYFFSLKMVRLILLIGPISSILSGIAAGRLLVWIYDQLSGIFSDTSEKEITQSNDSVDQTNNGTKKKKLKRPKVQVSDDDFILNELSSGPTKKEIMGKIAKRTIAFVLLLTLYFSASAFNSYSWSISYHLSNPSIIQKARTRSGTVVMIDDYREAYWWVRDNTPEDARVMAWWDYGYQLASIANRTTIADGNTWNHEHIALLGKIYTTDVDEAYSIARHLADYILVWAGGGGDDLAKSPHLARIANSVYRDLCPNDPVCTSFGLVRPQRGQESLALSNGMMPSPKMHASLVHHLTNNGLRNVKVDPDMFQEVFRSKYGKVRVYKIIGVDEESKAWVADPKNRICDAPGSWYCRGQYPPALKEALNKGKTFVQLEDFNNKAEDSEYQKQYHESLAKQRDLKASKERDAKEEANKERDAREQARRKAKSARADL